MAYSVEVHFKMKKDGVQVHTTDLTYDDMKYSDVVAVEQLGIQMINGLGQLGLKSAQSK